MSIGTPRNNKTPKMYRLDILIAEKAIRDVSSKAEINLQAAAAAGISSDHMRRVRRAPLGSSGYLTTDQLLRLAKYFGASIADLVNTDTDVHQS